MIVFRAQDRTTRKQLGILQIAFCAHLKELCGMRPNMRKPGRLLDTLSPQCAYEGFLRHSKALVSSRYARPSINRGTTVVPRFIEGNSLLVRNPRPVVG